MSDPGYYWFRHRQDASAFIAFRDEEDFWYMPAIGHPFALSDIEEHATLLGRVPRCVVGGGSVDQ